MHGLVASVVCGLVRGYLPPFAYGLVAGGLVAALVALALLGELAGLLRRDAAWEWAGALPATAADHRRARTLHLLATLAWLSLGPLVPAAALAPAGTGAAGRLVVLQAGAGAAVLTAALLLLLQLALGRRSEAPLVLLQVLVVAAVVALLAVGPSELERLAPLASVADGGAPLLALPLAWLAAPLGDPGPAWMPAVPWTAALLLLALLPAPPPPPRSAGEPLLARILAPVRVLAARAWVRADERGPFDLVHDALPREREVVLRTYPMVGIPLAFLVAGAAAEPGAGRADLLAVLLFTACVYLPVLVAHVPASESHEASWIHRTAPIPRGAVAAGAVKALAVRFLVPLYLVLAALAWGTAGLDVVLRLALPGFLVSLLVTRALYVRLVRDPPLSVPPDSVRGGVEESGGLLVALAIGLTIAAVAVNRLVASIPAGLALAAALALLEHLSDRALRRRLG